MSAIVCVACVSLSFAQIKTLESIKSKAGSIKGAALGYEIKNNSIDRKGDITSNRYGVLDDYEITDKRSNTFMHVKAEFMALGIVPTDGIQMYLRMNKSADYAHFQAGMCNLWADSMVKQGRKERLLTDKSYTNENGSEFYKYYFSMDNVPKARVEVKTTAMSKPLVHEYSLPFKITLYDQRTPEKIPGTLQRGELINYDVYDVTYSNPFKVVFKKDEYQKIDNTNNKNYIDSCVIVKVTHNHQTIPVTYCKQEVLALLKTSKDAVIPSQDMSPNRKSDEYAAVSLVLKGKPKIRIEIKTRNNGKLFQEDYDFPFAF